MPKDWRVIRKADKVVGRIEGAMRKRMTMAVMEVKRETLKTLSMSSSPSAPGQPPGTATGRLKGSVQTQVRGEKRKVIGVVGTPLDYGAYLEFGTFKMAARPWLARSFKQANPKRILRRKWF